MSENACGKAIDSNKPDANKPSHICNSCGKSYTEKSSLTRHMRSCCPERLIDCPTCGKGCFSEKSMKQHHARVHNESIKGTEVECDICGKITRKSESRIERSNRDFCSPECQHEAQKEYMKGENNPSYKGGHNKNCSGCGDEFWVHPATKHYEYCSMECYMDDKEFPTGEDHPNYNSLEVECEWCGETLERTVWRVNNFNNQFCDDDCRGKWLSENLCGKDHPAWRGGFDTYYGPNWKEQREKARERDGCTCQVCGKHEDKFSREHSVHHIQPIRQYKDEYEAPEWWEKANRLDNLVTLCHKHHRKWEGIPLKPKLL